MAKKIYTVKKVVELSNYLKIYDEYKERKIQNRDINIDSLNIKDFPKKWVSLCIYVSSTFFKCLYGESKAKYR